MGAFIMAISLICQNQKLIPNALPGETPEAAMIREHKEAEKSCLKKLYNSCNHLIADQNKLTDCMAKNM